MRTVHRLLKHNRRGAAEQIRKNCWPSKCVIHWDGKLMPNVTGVDTNKVDELPVLVWSLGEADWMLLGTPKLAEGSGHWPSRRRSSYPDPEVMAVWNSYDWYVFTHNSIKYRSNEWVSKTVHASWARYRTKPVVDVHHMFKVLLSDSFGVCFGQPSRPKLIF